METLRPNLFIVGAAKSGTSSLHDLLSEQKKIEMSIVKEPNYFSDDLTVNTPKSLKNKHSCFDKNGNVLKKHKSFIDNEEEYLKMWTRNKKNVKYLGESSVSYVFSKKAAKNIFSFNKNSKIIIILRNPIDRTISHIHSEKSKGRFKKINPLDPKSKKFIWDVDSGYIEQVKRFIDLFSIDNVLILKFEDLRDKNLIIKKISKFLGLPIELKKIKESNSTKQLRYSFLNKLIPIAKKIKVKSLINYFQLDNFLYEKNLKKISKQKSTIRKDIIIYKNIFNQNINNLKKIIPKQDFSDWLIK